ncbi:MAG: tRNA (guanosine(18)-2'-O)-methyltransferase TrmH [Desulfobacteraceae bacterium]|jgi:tRNA (guanosine-2'-O-)-methyltransferase
MNKNRFKKIKKLLEKRQHDLTVLMDNVHKPHNLAAIARTCDAVGIYDIHATARTEKIKITQKTSGGVKKWVRLTQHHDTESAVKFLKQDGFQVVAAHLTDNSVDFRQIDFTKKTALVMGAELDGISKEASELSDKCIHIPMHGMTQSLNVSVACALILFEAERQRSIQGMYDTSRLETSQFEKALFELVYPDIALFCRQKNIDYPQYSLETGKLLKPFLTSQYLDPC